MKKVISSLAIVLAVTVLFSSCGMLNSGSTSTASTTTSNATAYSAGQTFGTSFLALYNQYKTTKKIDTSNVSTLLNLASLATSCATIKDNLKDKTFYGSFATGLIAGSQQTVTTSTVDNVINSISGLDFSAITNAVNSNSSSVSSGSTSGVTNALTTLFNTLNK